MDVSRLQRASRNELTHLGLRSGLIADDLRPRPCNGQCPLTTQSGSRWRRTESFAPSDWGQAAPAQALLVQPEVPKTRHGPCDLMSVILPLLPGAGASIKN